MGAIKDLVDLVGRLTDSVKDRKFAAELREIQRMIGGILFEHAELHENRIALMTDNEKLKKQIPSLEARIVELEKERMALLNPPHTDPPTDEQISIMRTLTHPYNKVCAADIAKKTGISHVIVDHLAEAIDSAGFIHTHYSDGIPRYSLTRKGRTFLYERKMLVMP
jgi:predicted transcriptional regulator